MKRISRNPLFLCLLVAPLSQVASATSPAETDRLDEVVVQGTRAQLNDIFQEVVTAEDKFFDRYNELNTNDEFDMHCEMQAHIGTAIRRRFCRVAFMESALETEARDHAAAMKQMINQGGSEPRPWAPPVPPIMAIEAKRKEYQQNMRDVVSRNPELIKMLKERSELEGRYEATRRKVWGLRPSPEEVAPGASDLDPANP